jgi:outer membrane protein
MEVTRSREATAQATTAEVRLQVRMTFYRALQAQTSRAIADEVRKTRDVTLRQVRTFAENELRSIVDVSFAEIRLSEADLLIIRAENEHRAALIELASTMGLDGPKDWVLEEPSEPQEALDVNQAIEQVINKRPELAAIRHQLEAARKQLESDRRLNYPTVAGTGVGGYIPAGDPRLRTRYAGAAINITLPVLNGHAFSARRQESEARIAAIEKQYRDLIVRVRAGVQLSYLNLATAQASILTTRRLQEHAERTLRLTEARYSAGLGTIVELNQAQTDAVAAQLGHVTARYEAGIRRARLDFEIGNLL